MSTRLSFGQRLRSGPPPLGTLITVASAAVVETLSLTGLDWLFIDMEHGTLTIETVENLVRAVRGDCLCLVRVPDNSPMWIKKVLDTGCDGLIIPMVCSADDARRAVEHAKYPPEGRRSVGVGRAHGYGLSFADYVARANVATCVVIQIEHIEAVRNVESILDVPGVDAVLIGPYDLSGSLNLMGQVTHPDVRSAIDRVRLVCHDRHIPHGMFVMDPQTAPDALAAGVGFLAIGSDLSLLAGGVKRAMASAGTKE